MSPAHLYVTLLAPRGKKKAAAITWGMHEISKRRTAKLSKKFYCLKTTVTGPKEPNPQASEKRWWAPNTWQVGKHQEEEEEAGLGQQNKQAPMIGTQSLWISLQPAITYTALTGRRWISAPHSIIIIHWFWKPISRYLQLIFVVFVW